MSQAAIAFAWRCLKSLKSSDTMSTIIARKVSMIDNECGVHSAIRNARKAANNVPSEFVHLVVKQHRHPFVLFVFCKGIAFSLTRAESLLVKRRKLSLFPRCVC